MSAERTDREHGDAGILKSFIKEGLEYKDYNSNYLCSANRKSINTVAVNLPKVQYEQNKPVYTQKNRVYSDS